MIQKIRAKFNNKKGFTLIELMIVIAIIGILAAIAVPQFLSYRIRSYNTAAKAVINNVKADQGNFNAEHGIYAETVAGAQKLSVGGGTIGGGGAPINNSNGALAVAAVPKNPGAVICGWAVDGFGNNYGNACVGIALGSQMNILALDYNDTSLNSNYHMFARHSKGDTAYAIDCDVENQLWYNTNADAYVGVNTLAPAPTGAPAWPPAADLPGQYNRVP